MTSSAFNLRLQQLETNIAQTFTLLNEFEIELRDEDHPGIRSKYRRRIEQLRELLTRHQQEYDELQKQVTGEAPAKMQDVATELQQVNAKLNTLGNMVLSSYVELRRTLLARYAATERSIVAAIAKQLNQNQLVTVQAMLDALETNRISEAEIQQLLAGIQEMLAVVEAKKLALPPAVAEVINHPAFDAKHKLKVSIPIIPFLLDYEGELELAAGFNLKAAWERWIAKSRRN
ncbi:hypothetical protein [Microseira sp. BLCC-F43]|uniref:hypothetical protein n=1 Tax=Microseira sp. BLCC-F43 TaxID=3153602 RepID=UPI0035B8125A